MVPEEVRCPLVRFPAHETIKVLEPLTGRPLIIGSCHTILKAWCIMILTKPGSGVSISLKYISNTGIIQTDDGIIPGITSRQFADHTATDGMMVTPRDQGSP